MYRFSDGNARGGDGTRRTGVRETLYAARQSGPQVRLPPLAGNTVVHITHVARKPGLFAISTY